MAKKKKKIVKKKVVKKAAPKLPVVKQRQTINWSVTDTDDEEWIISDYNLEEGDIADPGKVYVMAPCGDTVEISKELYVSMRKVLDTVFDVQ